MNLKLRLKFRKWLDEKYCTNNGEVAYISVVCCVIGFLLCMLILKYGGLR